MLVSRLSLPALLLAMALGTMALGPLAPEVQAQGPASGERPNVLFVSVDDLGDAVGFLSEEAGNPLRWIFPDPAVRARVREVLTPNIDRLAAAAVPFAEAHTSSAVCAPSRAALMTGVRTATSGFIGGGHFRANPALADVATLPEHLRANGYYTAGVGKVYHNSRVELAPDGSVATDWPDAGRSWDDWVSRRVGRTGPIAWDPWSPTQQTSTISFGITTRTLEEQKDYLNADIAARLLRDGAATAYDEVYREERALALPSDRPFFLAVGLYRPHFPLIVPDELLALFDPADIAVSEPLRRAFLADLADTAPAARAEFGYAPGPDGGGTTEGLGHVLFSHGAALGGAEGEVTAWREIVRHYLASVAMADRIVGHLLDALEAGPYGANTAVVLWGDHGFHLGEKAHFAKQMLWDESTHTPLLIRPAPSSGGAVAPGVLRRAPVSLVDVYPTVTGMAGVPTPAHVQGVDLAPMLAAPEASAGSAALTTMGRRDHALRTERWRYIRYDDDAVGEVELYEVRGDPEERVNLAGDPAYRVTRDSLEAVLVGLLTGEAPPPPPPPSEATAWVNEIHYDDAGHDSNEGVEIAGTAGLDLTGWTVSGYARDGRLIRTLHLSQTLPDEGGGLGAFWIRVRGMPNARLGIAVVDPAGEVVQFVSYEGVVTASGGPAAGATSVDIGVSEGSNSSEVESLQLVGEGTAGGDFAWTGPAPQSQGSLNAGQTAPPGALRSASGAAVAALTWDLGGEGDLGVAPSPLRGAGTVRFALDAPGEVTLAVFDARGREVRRLSEGRREAGAHAVPWEAGGLAPGVYTVRLTGGGAVRTVRAVVVR